MKTLSTFALILLIATAVQAAPNSASSDPGKVVAKDSVGTNPTAIVETTQCLHLSMKNTQGEVMMQQEVTASSAPIEIKLPQLPAGLYLVTVKNGAKAQTQKFTIR